MRGRAWWMTTNHVLDPPPSKSHASFIEDDTEFIRGLSAPLSISLGSLSLSLSLYLTSISSSISSLSFFLHLLCLWSLLSHLEISHFYIYSNILYIYHQLGTITSLLSIPLSLILSFWLQSSLPYLFPTSSLPTCIHSPPLPICLFSSIPPLLLWTSFPWSLPAFFLPSPSSPLCSLPVLPPSYPSFSIFICLHNGNYTKSYILLMTLMSLKPYDIYEQWQ